MRFWVEWPHAHPDSPADESAAAPVSHDQLRLDGKVFLSNIESDGKITDAPTLIPDSRCFDPITSAFLLYSSFFERGFSTRPVSGIFLIDRLTPDQVAVTKGYFIAKTRDRGHGGQLLPSVRFRGFRKGLPVVTEGWWMGIHDDTGILHHRTLTKWERVKKFRLPVRIKTMQVLDETTASIVDAKFSWRFDADVPERLFQVKDVHSKRAMEW